MSCQLAIVIPFYKAKFFKYTLESIASQSNKEFNLYICDDHSPDDISKLVNDFSNHINIIYHRFEDNLGGKDLVSHWTRSISLTSNEPYIWLFSDDDMMEPGCVQAFYDKLNIQNCDLIHFNLRTIDEENNIIKDHITYPSHISTKSFIDKHLSGKLFNTVVEFIFSRKIYDETGGFVNFDLAWGSDFITWVNLSSKANGVHSIDNSRVLWRTSAYNITPNKNRDITIRKFEALIENYVWLKNFFKQNGYSYGIKYDKKFYGELLRQRNSLLKNDGYYFSKKYYKNQGCLCLHIIFCAMWTLLKIYK